MFFEGDRIDAMREMILADTLEARQAALGKLLPYQRDDFAGIFRALKGYPATIRFLDPPLHEFLPHEPEQQADLAKKLGLTVREAIPNHQVLFTANGKLLQPGQTAYGDTLAASGYNDTWFYIGSVPRLATFSRTVNIRESIAHELTHQWRVNPPTATTGGHCGSIALALGGKTMYDDGSRACPMSRDLYASGDPQEGDGIFKFHYQKDNNGKVDSEYLRIRRREEPVPQSDPPDRPEPQ